MNSLEQLANQINETKEIMQVCKENHEAIGLPDFVSELEISSLQQRLVDLERKQQDDEVERSQSKQLEVIMYPKELPPGHIQVRTLTTILGGLQSLTDSVANTLYNQPSDRGPIPQEILDSNSWILKTVRAGSFVAVLDLKHENQLSLDEVPQTQIIKELFSLFNVATEEEPLLEIISALGSRTLKYYMDWTKNLRDLNVPIELEWISPLEGLNKVQFDTEKLHKIFYILNKKLTCKEEEVQFEGRLTGINVRIGSFELCSEDGEKVTGRILKEIISDAIKNVDRKCMAQLLKTTTTSSAGKVRINWILNNIQLYLQ